MIDRRRLTDVKVTYEVNTILSDLYNQIEYELRDDYNDSLEKLQSNWDSLREWLENNFSVYGDGREFKRYIELHKILDKMNELEGREDE